MESLKLWIALTPKQLEELNKGNEVFPDEYSGRFCLRLGPKEAVDRAQYFMDWTPEGLKGEHHQKDYAVMEMEIFALGYLLKVESGILEKTKPTEYRWHGPVKCEEWDSKRRLVAWTPLQELPRYGSYVTSSPWRQLVRCSTASLPRCSLRYRLY